MGLLPHKKALCRPLALVLTCALMCALGAGCQQTDEKHETTIFAMDTVMTLTVYGDGERIGGQNIKVYILHRKSHNYHKNK